MEIGNCEHWKFGIVSSGNCGNLEFLNLILKKMGIVLTWNCIDFELWKFGFVEMRNCKNLEW